MFWFRKKVIELAGVKLRLGRHIVPEVRKHFDEGSYEWPELVVLQEKLEPHDVVMEMGTGIGFLSAWCALVIGSERVFTYEANPELEVHIRDTYHLNNVWPTLEMCMLGEPEGMQNFYIHRAFWESSTIPDERATRVISVPRHSFHDALARIKPTMLIIDIEGGEYDLCRYAQLSGVRKIILEIHQKKLGLEKTRALRAVLYRAGFRVERRLCNWDVLYLERQ